MSCFSYFPIARNYPHAGTIGIWDTEGNVTQVMKDALKQLNQGATSYVEPLVLFDLRGREANNGCRYITAAFDPRIASM